MVIDQFGAPQGNAKRYERACAALISAATKADARMLEEAISDAE